LNMAGHSHGPSVSDSDVAEDGINIGKIVLIGLLSLAVFAAGIVWAYFLMVARQNDVRRLGPARVASEIGKSEIGIVDQVPFETDTRLEEWREMSRRKLAGHGWVDRANGIARIPIEVAMERVVANPPDIAGEGSQPMVPPALIPAPAPSFSRTPAPAPSPGSGPNRTAPPTPRTGTSSAGVRP
jgi:hypothetical protein